MLTYKLKIKNISNTQLLDRKVSEHSYAFRYLYNNFGQKNNTEFLKNKFNLDTWQIVSLKLEVVAKLNQTKTFKKKMTKKLQQLESYTPKNKGQKYKIQKKIRQCRKTLQSDIVFGGKNNLIKLQNGQITKEQWKQLRLIPKFISGQNFQKHGNRKIKFQNNCFVYKVGKQKINIQCYISKNRLKIINKLIQLTKNNKLGLSYRLTKDYVYLSFDQKYLNGYQQIRRTDWKKGDKEYNRQLVLERKNHLLKNKKQNRYLSVDLNPQYIGLTIADKTKDSFNVVLTKCFNLSNLNTKLKLSSDNPVQIKQNNKRKYEISLVWKHIFDLTNYYKVAYFVQQQLNFKQPTLKSGNKNFNKKCKNLWHLNLTQNLIQKWCNIYGIQKITVNAAYSSFIGNIQHNYNDPVNASIQICRRGMYKFNKNMFYPNLTETDRLVMSSLLNQQMRNKFNLNTVLDQFKTWIEYYNLLKKLGIRYRRPFEKQWIQFKTIKSKVVFYNFL